MFNVVSDFMQEPVYVNQVKNSTCSKILNHKKILILNLPPNCYLLIKHP